MEKFMPLSEAKMKLHKLVDNVDKRDDEIVITKNGKPVAALVPAAWFEGWKETQEIKANKKFMKEIERGIKRLKRGRKGLSFEEVFGEPL